MTHHETLAAAGLSEAELAGGTLAVHSPIDGAEVAKVKETKPSDMPAIIAKAQAAFRAWRQVPAPRRGELVRLLGEELRAAKHELGAVVTLEAGKITSEGLGEVQEMIDICDFAVGQSRQLYGLTIASERPGHRMMETWHPLGPCGVITAFNFPVAVWSWNTALALVCGDPVIWKPSEKTPLTAMTTMKIFERAMARFGDDAPDGLVQFVIGGAEIGEALGFIEGRADRLGHRLDPHGLRRRPQGAGAVGAADPRTGRQQRHDRRRIGRHRHGRPGHRVLGGRDRGSALHLAAPGHRA